MKDNQITSCSKQNNEITYVKARCSDPDVAAMEVREHAGVMFLFSEFSETMPDWRVLLIRASAAAIRFNMTCSHMWPLENTTPAVCFPLYEHRNWSVIGQNDWRLIDNFNGCQVRMGPVWQLNAAQDSGRNESQRYLWKVTSDVGFDSTSEG